MARNKKVRVELSRADFAKRGLVALVVIAAILGLIFAGSGIVGGPDQVTARVTNAGGSMSTGADVKMRGLIVGSVASITRDSSPECVDGKAALEATNAQPAVGGSGAGVNLACVDVTVNMSGGMLGKIPSNVVARILPATVFGTSYLDLTTHGASSPQPLHAGAVVPADATQGTLELQKALDDIDKLVKVINPAKLNATLTAAAQALDGRGAELGSLIQGLNSLFNKLTPTMPLLRSDVGELVVNLNVLKQAAPALLDGVGDSLGTLQAIATQQASLATLLTGGRALADQANTFLGGISANLTTFLNSAAVIVNTFDTYRTQAFSQAFAALQRLAPNIVSVLANRAARQDIVIQTSTPNWYTAADCPTFGVARGDNCTGLGRAAVGSMLGGTQ